MRVFVVFACLVAAVLAADKYNSKYDNFDVDTLIDNDRLLKAYVNCFLDKGRCTPEGADFKSKSFYFNIFFIIFCILPKLKALVVTGLGIVA